ncbi:2-methylthioadenine synthetase [Desulforapulum autotrophicum HRM2]|uniref:Ribosomal protein uS12 methylthiotransferase RimO n=1 Tax=Desulforapulum autotrophicum (strain ATCC 43914 / DSM 3382 / VKM B-1955 / HRM2) TaxID=177437 RepID=C0QIB5_DESAH|nr:30S ribosomal protein S12 methylthiotransferase RimO [Desulforapulum autotrophicum]ACN17859.1 2-methylthioadenine synthetase [Desulforapulum autotrophicum HRM2]
MMIFLESLGCCRNQVDSEVMLGRLASAGHGIVHDPSQADVIIVNTCGFISAASAEAVDTILDMAVYKRDGRCKRLVVTGCLPERFKHDDLGGELPEVDVFLGTGACDEIVRVVESTGSMVLVPDVLARQMQGHPLPRCLTLDYLAHVKISEGCDRHCTYCIIPRLRGIQRSRGVDAVVTESELLVKNGVKEIVLVGENTSDYGVDLDGEVNLAGLLTTLSQRIKALDPDVWIRLLYTHPSSLDFDVIRVIAGLDNVCTYFDVPIQHASSRILRRMGRNYTREDLDRLIAFIRKTAPDAALRTTLITGFPGETEADFNELLAFVKEIRFDQLGVFAYSDSDDLASHGLKDHVDEETGEARRDAIMAAQAEISESLNEAYLGKTFTVLVEENPDEGIFLGRTNFQAPEVDGITFIYGENIDIGTFVRVKITETHAYDLVGELV